MTSGQRKAHKYIWLLLVIIVPVIMIFAVKDLHLFSSKTATNSQYSTSKEQSLALYENDLVKINVFKNHIEIILKSTLKNASSTVYEMNEKGIKSNVIGQLTTVGIYKFNINNIPKGIIIYDDLKQVVITKFSF